MERSRVEKWPDVDGWLHARTFFCLETGFMRVKRRNQSMQQVGRGKIPQEAPSLPFATPQGKKRKDAF